MTVIDQNANAFFTQLEVGTPTAPGNSTFFGYVNAVGPYYLDGVVIVDVNRNAIFNSYAIQNPDINQLVIDQDGNANFASLVLGSTTVPGNATVYGVVNAVGPYEVSGTIVIDPEMNASFASLTVAGVPIVGGDQSGHFANVYIDGGYLWMDGVATINPSRGTLFSNLAIGDTTANKVVIDSAYNANFASLTFNGAGSFSMTPTAVGAMLWTNLGTNGAFNINIQPSGVSITSSIRFRNSSDSSNGAQLIASVIGATAALQVNAFGTNPTPITTLNIGEDGSGAGSLTAINFTFHGVAKASLSKTGVFTAASFQINGNATVVIDSGLNATFASLNIQATQVIDPSLNASFNSLKIEGTTVIDPGLNAHFYTLTSDNWLSAQGTGGNGGLQIGSVRSIDAANNANFASLVLGSPTTPGNAVVYGVMNAVGPYEVSGTPVIDTGRNASFQSLALATALPTTAGGTGQPFADQVALAKGLAHPKNRFNVTTARAIATVYQNTTGFPMFVSITMYGAVSTYTAVSGMTSASNPPSDGQTVVMSWSVAAPDVLYQSISFHVMPGDFYQAFLNWGSATLFLWYETY